MLRAASAQNASMLCVGLDPEPSRIPACVPEGPNRLYDFCAAIVDATCDLVCAFKPQIAYFAAPACARWRNPWPARFTR